MCKPIFFVFGLIFCLINNVNAQDVLEIGRIKGTKRDTRILNLTSIDGKLEKVKIIPDYVNRELKIGLGKDTLRVPDFWGVPPDIRLLNKNFIEIKYAVRGGSNLALQNRLIFCVNAGKLYESLHTLNHSRGDGYKFFGEYNINLILNGNNKNNYKISASIHDKVKSDREPNESYTYSNQTVLSFDSKQFVFYSLKGKLYDVYIISDNAKHESEKIDGIYPMIILGSENYYFVNRNWYQLGNCNELKEFF